MTTYWTHDEKDPNLMIFNVVPRKEPPFAWRIYWHGLPVHIMVPWRLMDGKYDKLDVTSEKDVHGFVQALNEYPYSLYVCGLSSGRTNVPGIEEPIRDMELFRQGKLEHLSKTEHRVGPSEVVITHHHPFHYSKTENHGGWEDRHASFRNNLSQLLAQYENCPRCRSYVNSEIGMLMRNGRWGTLAQYAFEWRRQVLDAVQRLEKDLPCFVHDTMQMARDYLLL